MIIAEDPRVTSALELRERGNAEPIQVLLRDGGLFNRKSSLDVLGDPTDISLDFLHVTGLSSSVNSDTSLHEEFDIEFHLQEYEGKSPPSHGNERIIISYQRQTGRLNENKSKVLDAQASPYFSSPPPELFGGMFDESAAFVRGGSFAPGARLHRDSIAALDDMELHLPPRASFSGSLPPLPPPHRSSGRTAHISPSRANSSSAGISTIPEEKIKGSERSISAPISIPQRNAKNSAGSASAASRIARAPKPPNYNAPSANVFSEERQQARRSEGIPLVGAYSPEARKMRVARFVEKRERRVWRKKVKYDVRKNFADSRLRVKGRFVRKEDESLLRDLMSMV